MTDDKWLPILDGDVYCAPRCGVKCTKAAFDQATAEAAALAARMGDGWEPHIWENGGWNYQVAKGCAIIRVDRKGTARDPGWSIVGYSAWVEFHEIDAGCGTIQFIEKAETPEDALGIATQRANSAIVIMRAGLDFILDAEKPEPVPTGKYDAMGWRAHAARGDSAECTLGVKENRAAWRRGFAARKAWIETGMPS